MTDITIKLMQPLEETRLSLMPPVDALQEQYCRLKGWDAHNSFVNLSNIRLFRFNDYGPRCWCSTWCSMWFSKWCSTWCSKWFSKWCSTSRSPQFLASISASNVLWSVTCITRASELIFVTNDRVMHQVIQGSQTFMSFSLSWLVNGILWNTNIITYACYKYNKLQQEPLFWDFEIEVIHYYKHTKNIECNQVTLP